MQIIFIKIGCAGVDSCGDTNAAVVAFALDIGAGTAANTYADVDAGVNADVEKNICVNAKVGLLTLPLFILMLLIPPLFVGVDVDTAFADAGAVANIDVDTDSDAASIVRQLRQCCRYSIVAMRM